jgi:hypothetical protein
LLFQIEKKLPHRLGTHEHEACEETHNAGDEQAMIAPRETENMRLEKRFSPTFFNFPSDFSKARLHRRRTEADLQPTTSFVNMSFS